MGNIRDVFPLRSVDCLLLDSQVMHGRPSSFRLPPLFSYAHQPPSSMCLFFFVCFKFIYLFLAVLCLCCCARAFSSCGKQGLFFVAVRGLLIAVASLVAEHGLQAHGLQQLWLSGSRAQAQQLWCTRLAAPRHVGSSQTRARHLSPALAGGFLTTAPPGKPYVTSLLPIFSWILTLYQMISNIQSKFKVL